MKRSDRRKANELRPVKITRAFTNQTPGAVLIETGGTRVLCTATFQEGVPKWRSQSGLGWVTAEYDMLPGSTSSRRPRNRGKIDGRTQEIQRLIGRTLRSAIDFERLGENTIQLDCDVLQADGGTRTASITGAMVALADAVAWGRDQGFIKRSCITEHVAAVSVGIVDGRPLLDLNYEEDVRADVDLNLAQTSRGQFIEVQGTGEAATFSGDQLNRMLALGAAGIRKLIRLQKAALRG
jgi:ribonuclease PH